MTQGAGPAYPVPMLYHAYDDDGTLVFFLDPPLIVPPGVRLAVLDLTDEELQPLRETTEERRVSKVLDPSRQVWTARCPCRSKALAWRRGRSSSA